MIIDKKWVFKPKPAEKDVKTLASAINVSEPIAQLLIQRGIHNFDEAKMFFRPGAADLFDPFLMKDMDKAVARILRAIDSREKILIFGDYDVDGTSSVAMVYSFFKNELGYAPCAYYIPDRYTEGYGVSKAGIQFAMDNEFSLIICLDCGIKSVDLIGYAKQNQVDFIVCDHHLPGKSLPEAAAILNAKQPACNYPFKELCGCGVGFKLLQALSQKIGLPAQDVFGYLDMVAVATCCDIVPLTGENRVLVAEGLKILNAHPRPGIKKMMELAKADKRFAVEDVVFIIGPRINAAGRIKHGVGAVELLTASGNDPLLGDYAALLQNSNRERQGLDKLITAEALEMINESPSLQTKKSNVLFNASWHKGVVGIVASRVLETYYKPTIILTESNGLATGSARSIKGFDIHEAIDRCGNLLENYGGHTFAAGLSLKMENLEQFQQIFEQTVNTMLGGVMPIPEVEIDAELPLERVTPKFYHIIQQLAPFGPANMDPVFCCGNLVALDGTRIVGDNHLKMVVAPANNRGLAIKAIGFKLGAYLQPLLNGATFSIAYNLRENEWMGNKSLELDIKDIQITHLPS
jgi:single-stranded-DNA-specific exonuclease